MNIISSVLAPKAYKYTLSVLILNLMISCRYMSKTDLEKVKYLHAAIAFIGFTLTVITKLLLCKNGSRAVY